jgi:hypothetical protein
MRTNPFALLFQAEVNLLSMSVFVGALSFDEL